MSTPHEYYYKSIKKCEEKDNRYFGCSHENIYTRKITMLVIKAKIDVAYEWSHDTCKSADNFHSLFVPNTTPSHYFSLFSFLFISHLFIHHSSSTSNQQRKNPISKLFKLGRVNNDSFSISSYHHPWRYFFIL
jgi:hypothetical protein